MPSERLSIESQKLLGFVTRDWQPLDQVIELSLDGVPPGKALRNWQRRATSKEARSLADGKQVGTSGQRQLSEDEKIVSGAKDILRSSAYGHRDRNRVEIEVIDGVRMIRLKERRAAVDSSRSCPLCQRPFRDAPETQTPPPPARSKVVYPSFPAWDAEWSRKAGS